MGSIKIVLILFLTVISLTARAEEHPVLINYEQLMNLSVNLRANYIRALRLALIDIEMDQRKEETFNSAISFFSQAYAAEITDQCIFAGWVGTFGAPVDGHRYCHAPPESLSGCGGGEIKCNPSIFGDNRCVKKDTFATSTCDARAASSEEVATEYLSNAALKKSWLQLADSIQKICDITTRQQNPCQKIQKRLKIIEPSLPAPKPAIRIDPAKTTIDRVVNHQTGTSTEKPPCKKDRLKGEKNWGTCHAFCTLCTLDRLAEQNGFHFRTSANWVVFLSAVDRVCNPGSNQPLITNSQQLFTESLKGGDPKFDFSYAVKYGFCNEEEYLPYSDVEPPQTTGQQTEQGLNAHTSGSPSAFTNQFGIGFDDIKTLYCPNGIGTINVNKEDPNYAERLNNFRPSGAAGQKFLKCAQDSLKVAQKIKKPDGNLCKTETADLDPKNPDLTKIKAAIDKGLPVSLEISDPKVQHCVTAIADKNEQFDIINFHGAGETSKNPFYSTKPIQFNGDALGRKITSYWYVDCGQSASSSSSAQPANSRQHVK